MPTRLTTTAERRRRGFDELDLLMRFPPPIRLRSHSSVYPNRRGLKRATVAWHWPRSLARWTSWSGYSWREGHDRENAVKGGEPLHVHGGKVTKYVTYFDHNRALADLGLAPDGSSQDALVASALVATAGARTAFAGADASDDIRARRLRVGRDFRFDLGRLDRLAGEPQLEALEEPGNAVRIHLELVTGAKIGECLRLGLGDAAEVDELAEEPLEARG